MNALTREELVELCANAGIKQRVRRELRYTPEALSHWQDRDFLPVTNRAGNEGVLVAQLDQWYAVQFSLQARVANTSGRIEAIICDICATWRRGTESANLTFPTPTGSVSFLVCADLLCSLHVRGQTSASALSRTQLSETITPSDRIRRLRIRLTAILGAIVT